jgi:hypothetical protein
MYSGASNLRPPVPNKGLSGSGADFHASRSSLGDSRKSGRKNQINAYEQMFFQNSKGMEYKNQSQPNLPIPKEKGAQVVDLRGYGYTPERDRGAAKLAESTFKSGKKSMIGHSDFIPVG